MDQDEYRRVHYETGLEIYGKLNAHLRMLAEENGIVIETHKYPCMTMSMFVRKLVEKYKGA